ncbi:MAG: ferredoxin [Fibrobacterales bacterium]
MPNPDTRIEENVLGPFYVDGSCTSCEDCINTAPENFKLNEKGTNAFVHKQPEDEDEINLCREAMENCPTDSIGDDGD